MLDRMSIGHTEHNNHPRRSAAIRAITEAQLTYLGDWLPPAPARILDVGCGNGELARALERAGYAVLAIDIDPAAVAAAIAHGVNATEADMADFDADPFDAVLFSLSLHHMDRLTEALARA